MRLVIGTLLVGTASLLHASAAGACQDITAPDLIAGQQLQSGNPSQDAAAFINTALADTGCAWVPNGDFYLNTRVEMPSNSTLQGSGIGSVLHLESPNFDGVTAVSVTGVVIRGLSLASSVATPSAGAGNGIFISASSAIQVKGLSFYDFAGASVSSPNTHSAIRVTGGSTHLQLVDNQFTHAASQQGTASAEVSIEGASQLVISGNQWLTDADAALLAEATDLTLTNNFVHGAPQHGLLLQRPTGGQERNIVEGNHVEGARVTGIELSATDSSLLPSRSVVANNSVFHSGGAAMNSGCIVVSNHSDVAIRGNLVDQCGAQGTNSSSAGIVLAVAEHIEVSGNVLRDGRAGGIVVAGRSQSIRLVDNRIVRPGGDAIALEQATIGKDTTISHNEIDLRSSAGNGIVVNPTSPIDDFAPTGDYLEIVENTITGNALRGIFLGAEITGAVRGNIIDGFVSGLRLQSGAVDSIVAGDLFLGSNHFRHVQFGIDAEAPGPRRALLVSPQHFLDVSTEDVRCIGCEVGFLLANEGDGRVFQSRTLPTASGYEAGDLVFLSQPTLGSDGAQYQAAYRSTNPATGTMGWQLLEKLEDTWN